MIDILNKFHAKRLCGLGIVVVFQYFRFKSLPMRTFLFTLVFAAQSFCLAAFAQQDPIVAAIIKEANENSQLKRMSHELMAWDRVWWALQK